MGIHEAPRSGRVPLIPESLLDWFLSVRRDLPWRPQDPHALRDAYAVWISETMLQQTRVDAVIAHYRRWMHELPHLFNLAQAPESRVLELWQGLGYYSRARNLHKAAQMACAHGATTLPRTRPDLLALPGIGEYTAGAILSLAHHLPEAILDGNLVRLFSRWHCWAALPTESRAWSHKYWDFARQMASLPRPYLWNEAMMELGALVCTPKKPQCTRCPISQGCAAQRSNRQDRFPPPRRTVEKTDVWGWVFLWEYQGKLLLEKSTQGLLAHQWRLPWILQEHKELPTVDTARVQAQLGLEFTHCEAGASFRHAITRYRLRLQSVRIQAPLDIIPYRLAESEWKWVPHNEIQRHIANSLGIKALRCWEASTTSNRT